MAGIKDATELVQNSHSKSVTSCKETSIFLLPRQYQCIAIPQIKKKYPLNRAQHADQLTGNCLPRRDIINSLRLRSVSTLGVICQFSGPSFTVRPAKFESCSFPAHPIKLRDVLNISLTLFSRPYCKLRILVFYGLFWRHKSTGKNRVRNVQHRPRTRLSDSHFLRIRNSKPLFKMKKNHFSSSNFYVFGP